MHTGASQPSLSTAQRRSASKALAERALWDWVKENKPSFSVSTILPAVVLGPIRSPVNSLDAINSSSQNIVGLFDAKEVQPTFVPSMIDGTDSLSMRSDVRSP